MSSAQGSFVWLVGEGDVVELRPVRIDLTVGDVAVIGALLAVFLRSSRTTSTSRSAS